MKKLLIFFVVLFSNTIQCMAGYSLNDLRQAARAELAALYRQPRGGNPLTDTTGLPEIANKLKQHIDANDLHNLVKHYVGFLTFLSIRQQRELSPAASEILRKRRNLQMAKSEKERSDRRCEFIEYLNRADDSVLSQCVSAVMDPFILSTIAYREGKQVLPADYDALQFMLFMLSTEPFCLASGGILSREQKMSVMLHVV